jgi:mono/diheme cytochrome c family protein
MSRVAREAAAALLLVLAGATAAAAGPALDYQLNCQGCHLSDGGGTPGSVPKLADSVARFLAVPGGREYLAHVPGVAQAPLDDAATAAVLNWMLEHFDHAHVPADFVPYTATEVGELRKHPLTDVEKVRQGLIAALERH